MNQHYHGGGRAPSAACCSSSDLPFCAPRPLPPQRYAVRIESSEHVQFKMMNSPAYHDSLARREAGPLRPRGRGDPFGAYFSSIAEQLCVPHECACSTELAHGSLVMTPVEPSPSPVFAPPPSPPQQAPALLPITADCIPAHDRGGSGCVLKEASAGERVQFKLRPCIGGPVSPQ